MFSKKVKDPTELELLRIRVRNLEKQVAEIKVNKDSGKSLDLSINTAVKTQLDFDGVTTIDKSSIETTASHVIIVVGPMVLMITADGVVIKKAPQVQAEERGL